VDERRVAIPHRGRGFPLDLVTLPPLIVEMYSKHLPKMCEDIGDIKIYFRNKNRMLDAGYILVRRFQYRFNKENDNVKHVSVERSSPPSG
jgi:hypothetical protein